MTVPAQPSLVSIRKATHDDIPAILACLRLAFEDYLESYTQGAFLDTVLTPETLQGRLETMSVFVAVDCTNEIAGTISCKVIDAEEGHLRGMAMLPALRGTGIAGQLLRHAESELLRRNCKRITLDTTEPLQRAMRFYEKHGYHRSGKISNSFGMPLIEYEKVL